MKALFLLPLLSILFLSCKKTNTSDQLPLATQTGAGTFGCRINGEVFIPRGYDGTGRPNPHIVYDIGFNDTPYMTISAKVFDNRISIGNVYIGYGGLLSPGYYEIPSKFSFSVGSNSIVGCGTPSFDSTIQKWGGGYITKLDIPNRIISGTFDFKYKTTNCDTVFITDGRFDIKF